MVANRLGIPTLVQEQNSYAGVTNKRLGNKAAKICVAYEGMEQFFPEEKLSKIFKDDGNNKKKTENLVFLLIILVVP